MKRINFFDIILIIILWVMTSACTDVILSEPVSTLPTAVTEESSAVIEPAVTDEPTAVPTDESSGEETATLEPIVTTEVETATPTPTPAIVVNNCVAPTPPEGVFYLPYTVQPGDTLFLIGQKTRPAMTVADLAAANCLTNVNRIEVGQELLIWHSPTTGPQQEATENVTFALSPLGFQFYEYNGPLAFGEHAFVFNGLAGQRLTIRDWETSLPKEFKSYTLIKLDDEELEVGSVSSVERFYIDATTNGRQFLLPGNGEYAVVIKGRAGLPLDLSLTLDEPAYPVLGKPQMLELGGYDEVIQVSGTTQVGVVNRYQFTAGSMQTIRLTSNDPLSALILEDAGANRLIRVDNGSEDVYLEEGGSYVLTVCHCFSEAIMHGDYSFEISLLSLITEPASPPSAEVETIQMQPTMNDWMAGQATGYLDEEGRKVLGVYLPEDTHLTLTEISDSNLTIRLVTADRSQTLGVTYSNDRHFLLPDLRGGAFYVPEAGDYRLEILGIPEAYFQVSLVDGLPSPIMGEPVLIQFEAGASSAVITGETAINAYGTAAEYDRYIFRAVGGQTVTISMANQPPESFASVIVEDSAQFWIAPNLVEGSFTVPADGDYTIIVVHPKGEVYGGGPYEFTLEIN